ncbi:unnamed protein product, partial [Rotaria sp. Silwood2]
TFNREVQSEDTHLNTLRTKYKTFSSNLTDQERQQAEIMINKMQVELEQLQEQIEKRHERLNSLIHQRQELDQTYDRFIIWFEDKQRLISPDQTIPLKTMEIERLLKKYSDVLNEIKVQRSTLNNIIKLNENVKQKLIRRINNLEEILNDRYRQLNLANEQRYEFDRIMTKLNEWVKSIEQQIKDPFTNDLQQTTNVLKEKSKNIQTLFQSTRDHKYNRLLDSLNQRIVLLDEAIHERNEFDRQNDHLQILYKQLENKFTKQKQLKLSDINYPSNEQRLEQFKQLLKYLDETINNFKEVIRIQRLLTNKGHRIDFRIGGELNANLKNLDGQIHNEIERIERALQIENDFHHLDKELDSYLQISSEQLKSSQHHQDKGIIFQTIFDRLQQAEHELNKLIQLSERLINDLPRSKYEQLKRIIEHRQEHLQTLNKTCQQARSEHKHMIKTQHRLNEDLIIINDWFRRLIQDLTQPLELNLSLNNVNDLQDSMNQLAISIKQRLVRIEQALRDEPNLISLSDVEIRERLNTVEQLKYQVKSHLNKQRIILDDIHQGITQYIKLTSEVKTVI